MALSSLVVESRWYWTSQQSLLEDLCMELAVDCFLLLSLNLVNHVGIYKIFSKWNSTCWNERPFRCLDITITHFWNFSIICIRTTLSSGLEHIPTRFYSYRMVEIYVCISIHCWNDLDPSVTYSISIWYP